MSLGGLPITDPDFLLYCDFESGEGATALDQSGHSNHGTLEGDPRWVPGRVGGALEFNGDDSVDSGDILTTVRMS